MNSRPQGLSEARRGNKIFGSYFSDPLRGRPFGGGGTIAMVNQRIDLAHIYQIIPILFYSHL